LCPVFHGLPPLCHSDLRLRRKGYTKSLGTGTASRQWVVSSSDEGRRAQSLYCAVSNPSFHRFEPASRRNKAIASNVCQSLLRVKGGGATTPTAGPQDLRLRSNRCAGASTWWASLRSSTPCHTIERPPSARMCKRCSLLTELPRDRAEVSLFQWRRRRHIYPVGAAYAVAAWLLQLVRAELLGGITCVISSGRSP
jgi:hypothetical protein